MLRDLIRFTFICTVTFIPFAKASQDQTDLYTQISKRDGIMEGYQDGSMGLTNKITRAELIKVLMTATNTKTANKSQCFMDIQGHWSEPYVCTAKNLWIVQGINDRFYPDRSINYAESYKLINKALGYRTSEPNGENWYQNYQQKLADINALQKSPDPSKNPNRGDILKVILRAAMVQNENTETFENSLLTQYQDKPLRLKQIQKVESPENIQDTSQETLSEDKQNSIDWDEDTFINNRVFSFDQSFSLPKGYFGLSEQKQYKIIPPNANYSVHTANNTFYDFQNPKTEFIQTTNKDNSIYFTLPQKYLSHCMPIVLVDGDKRITELWEKICFFQIPKTLEEKDFVKLGSNTFDMLDFIKTKKIVQTGDMITMGMHILFGSTPSSFHYIIKAPDGTVREIEKEAKKEMNTSHRFVANQSGIYQLEVIYENENGPQVLYLMPMYVDTKPKTVLESEAKRLRFLSSSKLAKENSEAQVLWERELMYTLLNRDRRKNTLAEFTRDKDLEQIAQDYAQELSNIGYISHVVKDSTLKDRVANYKKDSSKSMTFGENLSIDMGAAFAQENLYNSPAHYQNIVNNKFHRVGIGVARGQYEGQESYFYVQVFAGIEEEK